MSRFQAATSSEGASVPGLMTRARVEGVAKDLLVAGIQQPAVLNVGCVVASIAKPSRKPRGEIGVNEQSCWPSEWKLTLLNCGGGELQSRQDVLPRGCRAVRPSDPG